MRIKINEQPREVDAGATLHEVRDRFKPGADVLVLNGAPAGRDCVLSEGDEVALIRRGEIPGPDELEAQMMARHTPGVHARLKRSCVGIAGLGGLGSSVAVALARIGVGRLILADFDIVEPSNLNRQQYFVDQIGHPKTEMLKANLERINPYVRVDTHLVRLTKGNVPEIFRDADVLVEAFDTAEAKAMIMESFAVAFADRPLVMAAGLAGHDSSNTIRTSLLGGNVYVVGDLVQAARPGVGLMAPRVGVASHHQANAVVRLLLGEEPHGGQQ